jgi:SAM-dependent methyltransferase
VYRTKSVDEVSWFEPHLETSLELIRATGAGRDARILDVGGGASTLVDDLLEAGFEAITVLDVSAAALAIARRRLGEAASRVCWIEGDITRVDLAPASVDVWHDRAALHFLVDASDRLAYTRQLRRAVAPGGHVILSTFGTEGPPKCSGLPVHRYDAADLQAAAGEDFILRESRSQIHRTPSGGAQPFIVCRLQRQEARSTAASEPCSGQTAATASTSRSAQ